MNNYMAMQEIRQLTDVPLTTELILHLHQVLTDQTLDNPSAVGRFRRPDEDVRIEDQFQNEVFRPPVAELLASRLQPMYKFANEELPDFFVHPVIRSIILHFWLAYEHPFVDGNGRAARGLFYWLMLRKGYWLCEFISISEILRKAPIQYGRSFLFTETDDNDLTYFILYQLEVISKAIENLHEYVAKKAEETQKIERLIRASSRLNHRQIALLSHALRHRDAIYSVKSHQTSHGVVYQTARTDLLELEGLRLLEKGRRGRTMLFRPPRDLGKRLKDLR
jgi:Fic family protein